VSADATTSVVEDEGLAPDAAARAQRVVSPARLMWWKFRRHKLAVASLVFLVFAYLVTLFAGFVSPTSPTQRSRFLYAPPQSIHLFDKDGTFRGPFVYGYRMSRDPKTLRLVYADDTSRIYPLALFVRGETHSVLGLFESDLHLFGAPGGHVFLAGTDAFGRDMFSRLLHGAQISLSVGLISVLMSLVLGLLIGGISGLFGGRVDAAIQRVIEAIIAIPTIPLWLGLAAAVPRDWPPVYQYFAILLVLSLVSWTNTARVARGRFLALREQDFVTAARLYGAGWLRIIARHLVPNLMSYVIVTLTLAIPGIIIGETALSFLGVGLKPPTVSWGVLLQEAQKIQTIQFYPWLWIGPAFCVVTIVLAFNFLGDGARDAADPFSR